MPFGNPGGQARRDLFEFAKDKAQRVDSVAARDRQCVGTVSAVALPDAARAAIDDCLRHITEVRREHLADMTLLHELARVHERRVAARLQANCRPQRALCSQVRHTLRLGDGRAERPFTENRLAGLQSLHHQVDVAWDADRDDDQVNVGLGDHLVEVVKRQLSSELRGRCLCRVCVGGAHSP